MGIFSGLSRRKFMQYAAAGAGGTFASQMFGARSRADSSIILPPGGKKFADVQLTYFQDSNWLHAPLWLSPIFQKDAGVSIKSRELYEGGDTMAKVLPQLLSRNPRFDWVQFPCLFYGAFAETGQLEPLDDYLAKYESSADYLKWVMPAYSEFYTKWNGKTYGVMLDGDIHVFHYRKSHFANPDLQKKFSARFQRELQLPKTWQEFLDCTQFFTRSCRARAFTAPP